ncbi:GAF domain-containing protein [Paraburkholderia sp. ZP32-5]|uniref:GAF domain-containing protein n=1 Tax=Paraburkholderia sp. ZP32-5 TaxID=2883245 RepID=UPI001F3FD141|nr:GAF domain-containing protein [Paraburkholderia sp. ZP32-5]
MRTATNGNAALILNAIARIARLQQASPSIEAGGDAGSDPVWHEFERSLTEVFGQRLFTVLAYDQTSSRLGRLHSNRLDINPVGGLKRVTQSRWAAQVLHGGEFFIGSTREDIKSVFSEYELLWSIGCESVLNIPVRKNGVTLGTMNLLGEAGLYDHADLELASIFAQLAVAPLEDQVQRIRGLADPDFMEQV